MISKLFPLSPHEAAVAIGQSLKRHRIAGNLTQQALAARSGVSQATLKRIEAHGKGSLEDVLLIASTLGLEKAFIDFIPAPIPGNIDDIVRMTAHGSGFPGRLRASSPRKKKPAPYSLAKDKP